jgi:hypothetical protein
MNKYVIGEGVVILNAAPNGTPATRSASINTFAVPEANQPNSSTLYVSVGRGPPLDIREQAIASDIQDYILSSAYPELFVRCGKADDTFYTRVSKLANFFQRNFVQFYVYMQLMDLMPDAGKAYDMWTQCKMGFQTEAAEDPRGLTGHAPIQLDLPGSSKPKLVRIPYLGSHAVAQGYRLLRALDAEIKPKKKLEACVSVRALLLTTLGTMSFTELSSEPLDNSVSTQQIHQRITDLNPFGGAEAAQPNFHPLHPSNHAAHQPDEVEAGSVEDYMSSLCYLLMLSNPPFLQCVNGVDGEEGEAHARFFHAPPLSVGYSTSSAVNIVIALCSLT